MNKLDGAGVTSGQILEGNEEDLSTASDYVTLEQYRHAVRDDGAMTRQRAVFSIDEEARSAIKVWMAEKRDALAFDGLGLLSGSSNSLTKVFYKTSSGVTSDSSFSAAEAQTGITSTDGKLTLQFISWLKTWAMTGGGRSYIPPRPVKVDGKPHYVLLCHPDALYDLRQDTTFQQAMREAEVRGKENPLFTGATAIWDGVVVHAHESCKTGTGGSGGTTPVTRAALLGAQSLVWAWGERPKVVQKKFDYDNQNAYAVGMICGTKAPQFSSKSYGALGLVLARTNVSGS